MKDEELPSGVNEDLKIISELQQTYRQILDAKAEGAARLLNNGESSPELALLQKLDQLTLKQHAVLLAHVGDAPLALVAEKLGWNQTTVRVLIAGAEVMLGTTPALAINKIEPGEYEARYSISKNWWTSEKDCHELRQRIQKVK